MRVACNIVINFSVQLEYILRLRVHTSARLWVCYRMTSLRPVSRIRSVLCRVVARCYLLRARGVAAPAAASAPGGCIAATQDGLRHRGPGAPLSPRSVPADSSQLVAGAPPPACRPVSQSHSAFNARAKRTPYSVIDAPRSSG